MLLSDSESLPEEMDEILHIPESSDDVPDSSDDVPESSDESDESDYVTEYYSERQLMKNTIK